MSKSIEYPVVCPYKKSGDGGQELRYMLRSLKNLENFNGQVFVVGDLEPFLTNVIHIRSPKVSYSPYESVENRMLAVIQDERVPDDFILTNDDFFITEPIELKPLRGGVIPSKLGPGYHNKAKLATRKWLMERGINKPLDYSIHVPMIINKQKRLEVHKLIKSSFRGTALLARIVYGNLFIDPEEAEYYKDRKTKTGKLKSGPIISTQYYTDELDKLFPEPSIYEKVVS